jgi:hypothetical protein
VENIRVYFHPALTVLTMWFPLAKEISSFVIILPAAFTMATPGKNSYCGRSESRKELIRSQNGSLHSPASSGIELRQTRVRRPENAEVRDSG